MSLLKRYFFSVLLVGASVSPLFGQYTLTVESSDAVAVAGSTVYHVYVVMQDPTDRMSAVYGNNQSPLELEALDGVFNSDFNSSWSASGINPAFLPFFPDMADDTYATIGLEGPSASSGIAGAEDPSLVEDASQPITPFFLTPGATNLLASTLTGASYYVLNTAANGLPDSDLRVKIMQVTTTGDFCGTINFQVFPLGVGADQEQLTVEFCGVGTFEAGSSPISGCIDEAACNFNPDANADDGSCEYPEEDYLSCEGDCINDVNENGTCDELEVFGCTIPQACNYDPTATFNDGSCDFTSCLALGCTDPNACNYDPEAVYEDGTCEYATAPYNCDGECVNDNDGDGICDEFEDFGCTDMAACNYDSAATDDDGSCFYADDNFDCDGNCLNDTDGDGVCDENEVEGCNDVNACNYDLSATENDGTCDFCSCSDAGTEGYGLEVELVAEHTDGELAGHNTYRLYVTTPNTDDFLSAVFGDEEDPLNVGTTTSFYQHIYGSVLGSDMIPEIYPSFPEMEFDSWVTIGLDQAPADGEFAPQVIQSTEFSWVDQFEAGGGIDIDDSVGGSWFVLDPNSTANAVSGDDQKILVAQLTTDGIPSGIIQVQLFNHGSQDDVSRVTLSFEGLAGTLASSCGCTDETACNYDENATDDDGSCEYAEIYYDCDGNCLADADGDGVCDEEEVSGCTDMAACNYNADATDLDDSCEYAEIYYDCDGNCLVDTDGDGVCDELEVPGCTDMVACNYDEEATEEDGSCLYADIYYNCEGECINDADGDGVCDEEEVPGCTDMTACNYDAEATEDDGSCWYAEANYNCEGECINDTDGDGVCDEEEVVGCLDEAACNYNADATDNDLDLCEYAEIYYDCDGNCLVDTDGDGVCDELEVLGCTDMGACNYSAEATEDDGSCDFDSCAGCTDMGACNYDSDATIDDGTCEYESCAGCTDETANNYDADATIDDGSCCYLAIVGGTTVDPDCNGQLGSVTLVAEGGQGAVTYIVGDESNDTGVFELAAGVYTVVVTDDNDCSAQVDIEIVEPELLEVSASATDETAAELGVGTSEVTGGTPDYDVVWIDAEGNVVDPAGLAAGVYTVTATDANGCVATTEVEVLFNSISIIDPIAFNMFPNPTTGDVTIQMPTAFDDVTIIVVDGVGRTVYSTQYGVLQGNTVLSLNGLAAGTYNVMITAEAGMSVRRLSVVK
ncbi:MAG: hypothetical protein CL823_01470 [Crocinitomicaceae bacterium]|nr:hypothetical protein [Crocinitomicaceae bacterium]